MKKSYLYEIPIFYVILALINYYFFLSSPAFFRTSFNPAWIGILLFAFRYGLFAAALSGISSAVYYLAFIWFFGERYYFEDTSFYFLPSLFIVVGTSLGIGIYRFQVKIVDLSQKLDTLIENNRIISEEASTYQSINKVLEKKVVTQMSTMATVYQGAQKLESTDFEDLYKATLNFFSRMMQAEQAAVYVLKNNQWILFEHKGWSKDDEWPHSFDLNEGLLGLCYSKKSIATIKELITDLTDLKQIQNTKSQTTHLIAAPLKIGNTDKIKAIYTIQKLDLIYMNSATINTLQFLVEWVARSIDKAEQYHTIRSFEIFDPDLNIFSFKYFSSRLKQEFYKSKNYYLPLSLCLFRVAGLEKQKKEHKKKILMLVSQLIIKFCSDSDIVAHYNKETIHFACLFSTSSPEKSEALLQNIKKHFQDLEISPDLSLEFGMSHFNLKTKNPEQLLENCERSLA